MKTVILSFVLLGLLSACAPAPQADTSSASKSSRVPASQLPRQQQQQSDAPAGQAPAAAQQVPVVMNVGNFSPGLIKAGTPISCDALNPDAIKKLTPETITWLAELVHNGLTRHEHYVIARDQGYEGEFGQGGHTAWLNAKPGRLESFERLSTAFAQQWMGTAAIPTRAIHHVDARARGYKGIFLCGGHTCFLEGKCDSLGRRL